MRVHRLLALAALAIPLSAAASNLDHLFQSLVQQAATQVTPVVTINGGSDPGVFIANGPVSGSFDSSAPLHNLSSQVASQFQRFPVHRCHVIGLRLLVRARHEALQVAVGFEAETVRRVPNPRHRRDVLCRVA